MTPFAAKVQLSVITIAEYFGLRSKQPKGFGSSRLLSICSRPKQNLLQGQWEDGIFYTLRDKSKQEKKKMPVGETQSYVEIFINAKGCEVANKKVILP